MVGSTTTLDHMPDTTRGPSSLNSALLKRPVLAWVIAALVLLSIGRTLNRLDLDPGAKWWWSVAVFGVVGYSVAAAMLWPRIARRRPAEVIALCWAIGLSPALIAFAAVLAELTREWVYWTAAGVAMALLAVTTRAAASE